MILRILTLTLAISVVSAQFGNLFEHMFRQQQQQQAPNPQNDIAKDSNWLEYEYDRHNCDRFLCQDTLTCVDSYIQCPCPFPASELKCTLPDKKSYVCVSKGGRDCSFVEKAWQGKV